MKKGAVIIAAVLLIAMIWRAPGATYNPATGATQMPDIRENFKNAFVWATIAVMVFFVCTKVNLWVGLFLLLASFSAWFPINTDNSEQAHQLVLYGVIWYFLCVQFLNTEKNINLVLNFICIIALANVAMLVMQGIFEFDPLHKPIPPVWGVFTDKTPNVGLMDCQNSVSALLAFSVPAFLRKKWALFLIPVFVGLVIAKVFAGPLALSMAAIGYGILYRKELQAKVAVLANIGWLFQILIPLICFAALVGYYFFVDVPDTTWRLKTWEVAMIDLFPQHWAFGSGIGHFKNVFASDEVTKAIIGPIGKIKQVMGQAHNEPVQMTFEMGIGFPLILLGYIISIIRRYRKKAIIPGLAFVIIAVDSLVYFPFHIALLGMVALTWMAILENKLEPRSLL